MDRRSALAAVAATALVGATAGTARAQDRKAGARPSFVETVAQTTIATVLT